MINKSPLRYPGGKSRACNIIDNILTKNFDINFFDTILSPFFGGGSFEIFLSNKYNKQIIANDKFTPLYNFWNQAKNNKQILVEQIQSLSTVTKLNFDEYRNNIVNLNNDSLLQATYYFIINRCSFSGATLSGGFSKEAAITRFNKASIDRISKLYLSNFSFYNLDCVEFINNNYNERTFMFLDPPYYLENKSKLYGLNGDMHETFNHEILCQTLSTKSNWLLTYNNCDFIKNLYKN